ncbi:MAG: VWA domain-containing protein [Acidobacteriota bacterium]
MRHSRWIGVFAAALFGGIGIQAAVHGAEPDRPRTFSGSADVVVVEVPVQVLRDGEPVRGLTAADFEVWAGKQKLPVTGFEMLDLEAPAPPSDKGWKPAEPVAARRHFLLLFDLAFSSPRALAKGEEAARGLLDHLHPSDLVAVAAYSPSRGPELLLGFTTDRRQARAALDILGKPEMTARTGDPLRLVLESGNPFGFVDAEPKFVTAGKGGGGGAPDGSKAGDRKAAVAEAIAGGEPPHLPGIGDNIERADRTGREKAVTAMARAFEELAKTVGSLYGRKYVVFFSEGFDASIFSGTADMDEQNHQAVVSNAGAVWGIDSEKRFGNTKAASDLEGMLEEFRRADCVIQSVDTGGLREGAEPGAQWAGGKDSLFLLADSTGGDFYENYNDLSDAMDKMLRRTSVTYVLAVQPPDLAHDGAWHPIRVDLTAAARAAGKTRVVHRPGFYAPRPDGRTSPTEKILLAARDLSAGEETGVLRTSVLAAPFPGSTPTAAWVPVLVEVDGESLLAGVDGWSVPVEIYGYAFDAQGQARDYFSQTLGLDLLKTGAALKQNGLKFFGHLDLPPGDWSVRVLVRNAATGAAGLRTVSVHVPEPGPGSPVLLPAFFPEPPGRWLMVREARPEEGVEYPFLSGGTPYIPASLPRLSPGREAPVALVAYHLPPGEVQAEARLRTVEGRDAGEGHLRVLGREAGADGAERLSATFEPPAGLAPGEYTLLVTLTDGAGGARSSATAVSVGEVQPGGGR